MDLCSFLCGVFAGGPSRCVHAAPQWGPGSVCGCEAAPGWQQILLPQPGGCGMPPAGVLLAALRHLPTAAHFQGNHGEVGGQRGDPTGLGAVRADSLGWLLLTALSAPALGIHSPPLCVRRDACWEPCRCASIAGRALGLRADTAIIPDCHEQGS